MKAVITGGGTGGHIYPALSVGLELKNRGWDILYIGSENGLESDIIPKYELEFTAVPLAALPRKLNFKLMKSIAKNIRGYRESRKIISDFKADIVFGTGGFVSGPVVMAAKRLGIKTLIHEQNVYPGIANRLLSYFVDRIALNYLEAKKYFPFWARNKLVETGNPIRESILDTERKEALLKLKLKENKKTILISGGSQGARSINKAMLDVYKYFQDVNCVQFIHISGTNNYNDYLKELEKEQIKLEDNFKIIPYLNNMEWAYAIADLVIFRAGATGLAEITAKGMPAILIPYPYAAGNHQEYNAMTLREAGAAMVIKDSDLNGPILTEKINEIIKDEKLLTSMKRESKKLGHPEACLNIVNIIEVL